MKYEELSPEVRKFSDMMAKAAQEPTEIENMPKNGFVGKVQLSWSLKLEQQMSLPEIMYLGVVEKEIDNFIKYEVDKCCYSTKKSIFYFFKKIPFGLAPENILPEKFGEQQRK